MDNVAWDIQSTFFEDMNRQCILLYQVTLSHVILCIIFRMYLERFMCSNINVYVEGHFTLTPLFVLSQLELFRKSCALCVRCILLSLGVFPSVLLPGLCIRVCAFHSGPRIQFSVTYARIATVFKKESVFIVL